MTTFTKAFRAITQYFVDAHWAWCYKLDTRGFDYLLFHAADLQVQAGWGTSQYHYFRSLQRFMARPRKDIHRLVLKPLLSCLACAFWVIVMLEAEPLLQAEVLIALEQVFPQGYLCTLILSDPFSWSWQVSQSLLLKNIRWWAMPDFLQMQHLAFRAQSWFYHLTIESWPNSPLGAFWQTPSKLTCAFYRSVCLPHLPKGQMGECWGICQVHSFLHKNFMFLVIILNKALLSCSVWLDDQTQEVFQWLRLTSSHFEGTFIKSKLVFHGHKMTDTFVN